MRGDPLRKKVTVKARTSVATRAKTVTDESCTRATAANDKPTGLEQSEKAMDGPDKFEQRGADPDLFEQVGGSPDQV